ncbi:hypothetical protein LJK88_03300 [Paenibacillus sp. P26]|nr:hypothetical protein LJK88_03300 [Paenibacillus sp. P26]
MKYRHALASELRRIRMRVWSLVLLLVPPLGAGQGWAMAGGEEQSVYGELRAGHRVETDKAYAKAEHPPFI